MLIPLSCIWKWFYYSPNIYKYYCLNKLRSTDKNVYDAISPEVHNEVFTVLQWVRNYKPWMNGLSNVMLTYFLAMFVAVPGAYLILNSIFSLNFEILNPTEYIKIAIRNLKDVLDFLKMLQC